MCNINNALTSTQFEFMLHKILFGRKGWQRNPKEYLLRNRLEWHNNASYKRDLSAYPTTVKQLQTLRLGQMGHQKICPVTAGLQDLETNLKCSLGVIRPLELIRVNQINKQLTPEQHRFELHRSSYTQIFVNEYIPYCKCIFFSLWFS